MSSRMAALDTIETATPISIVAQSEAAASLAFIFLVIVSFILSG